MAIVWSRLRSKRRNCDWRGHWLVLMSGSQSLGLLKRSNKFRSLSSFFPSKIYACTHKNSYPPFRRRKKAKSRSFHKISSNDDIFTIRLPSVCPSSPSAFLIFLFFNRYYLMSSVRQLFELSVNFDTTWMAL